MVPWGYRLGRTLSLATLAACLRVPRRLHAYGLQKRRRCSALCVVRRAGRLANPPSASRSSSGRRRQSGCASVLSVAAVVATFLALSAFTAAMHHTHARFFIFIAPSLHSGTLLALLRCCMLTLLALLRCLYLARYARGVPTGSEAYGLPAYGLTVPT